MAITLITGPNQCPNDRSYWYADTEKSKWDHIMHIWCTVSRDRWLSLASLRKFWRFPYIIMIKKACWIWLNKTRWNLILWSEKMPSEAEKELFKRTQLQKLYFNLEIKIVMEEWGCGTVIQEKQVQNLCEC